MRAPLPIVALVVALAAGACKVDINFDNTRFRCTDGTCPDGYACVSEQCVLAIDAAPAGGDDGGAPDGAPALQSCLQQFGGTPGYLLCAETETTCEFFHATGDGTTPTCNEICAGQGSTCENSFDATDGETDEIDCTRETEDGCMVGHSSQICICVRTPEGA